MVTARIRHVLGTAAALGAIAITEPGPSGTAAAQVMDAASFHAQTRVGGKTCAAEHEHYGEGTMPSRAGAESAARRAWESFTTWEYGRAWGSFANAAGQRMDCAQADGRWTCKTTARPCRR